MGRESGGDSRAEDLGPPSAGTCRRRSVKVRLSPSQGAAAMSDWNAQIIDEFRANHGRVGGQFEGAPLILLHHRGRKSGADYVSPVVSLADESDPDVVYVFASKAGAPTHPEWYRNLIAAGHGRVETGDGEYEVDVAELEGEPRDRIFTEQVRRYPGFAEYARNTAGIREIPVLSLRRRH